MSYLPTVTFLAVACGRSWARLSLRIERAKVLHWGNPGGGAQALRWPGRQRRHSQVAVALMVCPPTATERSVG
jgi:hypothetical protein